MLRPTSLGLPFFMMCLVGCALSHRPLTDGGFDARTDGSRDGDARTDTPIIPVDGDGGCPAGMQLCGGACVSMTAPDHCGSCSNDCTTLPGVNPAAVTCTGGACSLTGACAAGRADCDTAMPGCETTVNNATNCGACGVNCSGGTPVCSDDGAGHLGCTNGCGPGQTPCGSTCTNLMTDVMNCNGCGNACSLRDHASVDCVAAACTYACIAGYHDCSGTCAADNNPASCGASCTPCTAPANATPTCNSGSCGFACNAGFHLCGSTCVSDADVNSCGSSCTPCPTTPGGTATCSGGSCGITCGGGTHPCGTGGSLICASDTDPTHCGSSCMVCSPAPGGSAICSGGSCGTSCPSGMHLCSGGCASDTDPTRCGSSCMMCPTPANGTATCGGSGCSFTCNSGFMPSGASCVPTAMPCGNRMIDSGETCDDGNRTNGDGCSSTCQMEANIVVDACASTRTPIVITDRGMHAYTGTTVGFAANGPGSCSADGNDVVWDTTITVAGGFTYTVTLIPNGWNAILREGPTCAPQTCHMLSGTTATYSGSGTNSVTWDFGADSLSTTVSGTFTFTVNVM